MFDEILDKAIQKIERVQKSPDILSNFPFVFVHAMMWCLKGVGEQLVQLDQEYEKIHPQRISKDLFPLKWHFFSDLMTVRHRGMHHWILPISCYTGQYDHRERGRTPQNRSIINIFVGFYAQLESIKRFLSALKDGDQYRNQPVDIEERDIHEIDIVFQDFSSVFFRRDKTDSDRYTRHHLEVSLQTLSSLDKVVEGQTFNLQDLSSLTVFKANQPMVFDAIQDCLESIAIIMGNANRMPNENQMHPTVSKITKDLETAADVCVTTMRDKRSPFNRTMDDIITQSQLIRNPFKILYEERKLVRHDKRNFQDQYICGYLSYLCHAKKELQQLILGWYRQSERDLRQDKDTLRDILKYPALIEARRGIDRIRVQHYGQYTVTRACPNH